VLETDIKDVVRAVGSYLHSPTDELRNALLKEIEILDGQIDLGDWYSSRLRVPPLGAISSVIGRTSDIDSAMAVPSDVFNEQVALVKAAKAEVTEPSEESLAELRTAFDALSPRYG
ncbi:MAG: hypothetical protein WAM97_13735, partial [Acidimicrobiales bacterium]